MKNSYVYALLFILCFIFWLNLLGCKSFSTTPNISIIDKQFSQNVKIKTPSNFNKTKEILKSLSQKNIELAYELGKLPELQDYISENELNALIKLIDLFHHNPNQFGSMFAQMDSIGIKETRQYCSPLQALFWLSENGELQKNMNLIYNYTLKTLLDKSWNFEASIKISEDQITKIVNGIKNNNTKKDYLARRKRLSKSMYLRVINAAYKNNKFIFSKEARKIIEGIKDSRWENFDIVINRLNAPELIDYYERKRFNYVMWTSLPQSPVSPYYVFKYNVGECVSITGFTVFCLRKGGYSAREIREAGTGVYRHAITLFEMNNIKYVMDNGTNMPSGIRPYVKSELKK